MLLLFLITFLSVVYASPALIWNEETVYDAALIARRLLNESNVGTMATTYPMDYSTFSGMPFSLQEYYASCFHNGSLLLLFLPISRNSQNILASPKHAASISVWQLPHPSASQARVSLVGEVAVLGKDSVVDPTQRECYIKAHPDAGRWLPDAPDSPHQSLWARFDPISVYFVGGFGDEHYIGEIPLRVYQDPLGGPGTGKRGAFTVNRLQVQWP
ncbi:pyridoxamine 5'-phosphate oxidase-domain-containing protein [Gautieria morchelliformis]|nr:pyridoxamine 5'-phosphate oxidase-domain-containing protein [Gautieria morchelliformis]